MVKIRVFLLCGEQKHTIWYVFAQILSIFSRLRVFLLCGEHFSSSPSKNAPRRGFAQKLRKWTDWSATVPVALSAKARKITALSPPAILQPGRLRSSRLFLCKALVEHLFAKPHVFYRRKMFYRRLLSIFTSDARVFFITAASFAARGLLEEYF